MKGISTGEMGNALKVLVGESASGLSASTVSKLKSKLVQEFNDWQSQCLDKDRWVYVWADGIHSGLRGDDGRLCALVVIGVNELGKKHFLAIEDGMRESTQSWREVLLNLKSRGMNMPELAVGDGALGFWNALEEVYPKTQQQRCWVHKTANVLMAVPKLNSVVSKQFFEKCFKLRHPDRQLGKHYQVGGSAMHVLPPLPH